MVQQLARKQLSTTITTTTAIAIPTPTVTAEPPEIVVITVVQLIKWQ